MNKRFKYYNKSIYYNTLTKTHNYIKQCCRREYIRTSGDDYAVNACYQALTKVFRKVRRLIVDDLAIDITNDAGIGYTEYIKEQLFYFLFIVRTLRNAGLNCGHDRDMTQEFLKTLQRKIPNRHPKIPSRTFHMLKSSTRRWN